MDAIYIIWLIVIVLSLIKRFSQRARSGAGTTAMPRGNATVQPNLEPVQKKPVRVSQNMMQSQGPSRRMAERFGKKDSGGDASCETQFGHTHPERAAGTMRFGGRPDLEPGYMYLNGVKVLIKEADRLEFLR